MKPLDEAYGRMIFSIGKEDGTMPDLTNATMAALEYWWEERKAYHPKSPDYAEFLPFTEAWDFTQMVWFSSSKIG